MSRDTKLKVIDIIVFALIILGSITLFFNNKFSGRIDDFFLPERRNKGYYDILNNPSKLYESKEISENGTKNLLTNYLKSGYRDQGYSIIVNADGTYIFSSNYTWKSNSYEAITPRGAEFDLPSGDYVLSDGGASSVDSVYIKMTGVKQTTGGDDEYITLASLPDNALFHWDRDSGMELYCEMVICPGSSVDNLKFSPMLLKAEDSVSEEYMPCMTADYYLVENETGEGVKLYKYSIDKAALDGKEVTRDDWKIFLNSLKHQMQADRALIDLKDGYGITILKKNYPTATYGKFNGSSSVVDGQEINITDFEEVIRLINTNS